MEVPLRRAGQRNRDELLRRRRRTDAQQGGAAKWTARFDDRDNQIERAFFGLQGQPVVLKDGFARWTARFDDCGHRLEEAYFGVDGKPMLGSQGAAGFTYKYDEFGNRIEIAAFGLDGHPILLNEGFAKWTARFNARGNQLELAYFGVDGKPTLAKDRFAGWTSKFDIRGNRIETAYFGVDGQPMLRTDGLRPHRFRIRRTQSADQNVLLRPSRQTGHRPGRGDFGSSGSQGDRLGIRPDDVLDDLRRRTGDRLDFIPLSPPRGSPQRLREAHRATRRQDADLQGRLGPARDRSERRLHSTTKDGAKNVATHYRETAVTHQAGRRARAREALVR